MIGATMNAGTRSRSTPPPQASSPEPAPGRRPAGPFTAITRRAAIKRGFAGIFACAMAPVVLPSSLLGCGAPGNRIAIGLIGNGLICRHHVGALTGRDDCRILAVCDVWRRQAEDTRDAIAKAHGAQGGVGGHGVALYQHHEELLARDDIDAVFVCTPDHWHAGIANAAMLAGKDVYCEKPLTLTVREGRTLVQTARRHGRVLQTGTQQRSNRAFRQAAGIVRNGLIGEIRLVRTRIGEFPPAPVLPVEPVPDDFDYERWLGPTPWRPFHSRRTKGVYTGGWRCFTEYGGRMNGDWGAHHFDIVQWALGMDDSGPVEFIPRGWEGAPHQTHVYANGVRVERVGSEATAMIEFIGTEGAVRVSRGDRLETDPRRLADRTLRAEEIHLHASDDHHGDFLDAVRTRQRPIADVEIGHRSATVCHLNNIAAGLARPIRWEPASEEIIGDPVASRHLDRTRRAPYAL